MRVECVDEIVTKKNQEFPKAQQGSTSCSYLIEKEYVENKALWR